MIMVVPFPNEYGSTISSLVVASFTRQPTNQSNKQDVGLTVGFCLALTAIVIVLCCTREFYKSIVKQLHATLIPVAVAAGLVGKN